VEAAKWFRKAAEQGDAAAQYNLGVMCENGIGVPQDHIEAAKWYCMAAAQGDADSQRCLAMLFESGSGVPEDRVLAYALYSLSATVDSSRDNGAAERCARLAETLRAEDVQEGQALTRELERNFRSALDARLAQHASRAELGLRLR
jgi:TPR repeat protein